MLFLIYTSRPVCLHPLHPPSFPLLQLLIHSINQTPRITSTSSYLASKNYPNKTVPYYPTKSTCISLCLFLFLLLFLSLVPAPAFQLSTLI